MRLHHLELTAFGPFAGEVSLDLEPLTSAGVFLVHGATGAGKSSLLDAICFALYADVPGERTRASLHSQHAAPGSVPSVTLELTLDGRRLRIRRQPEFHRPKKRGEGTVREHARVWLDELRDGRWVEISHRIDEAAEELRSLLGMDLSQFRRVVMLPQGDFAAFLAADDEERRGVLERLFDISDYTGVETWLVAQRAEAEREVRAADHRLGAHLASLLDQLATVTTPLPPVQPTWTEMRPEQLPSALAGVDEALAEAAAAALEREEQTVAVSREATARLAQGQARAERRHRGERARATIDELQQREAEISAAERELGRAEAARAVEPAVQVWRRARREHDAATHRLDEALHELRHRAPEACAVREDGAAWSAWTAAQRDREHRLVAAAEALQQVRVQHVEHLPALRRREHELTVAHEGRRERQASLSTALAEAREELATATTAAQQLPEHDRALSDLSAALRRRQQADRLAAAATEQRSQAQEARQQQQDRRQHHLDLQQARLEEMAGELAEGLRDGAACLVCGSAEHPRPAHRSRIVTAAEIDDARAQHERAARGSADAEERLAATVARHETVLEQIGEDPRDEPTLLGALRAAEQDRQVVASSAAELPRRDRTAQVAEAALSDADTALRAGDTALAAVRAEIASGLATLRDGIGSLTSRLAELDVSPPGLREVAESLEDAGAANGGEAVAQQVAGAANGWEPVAQEVADALSTGRAAVVAATAWEAASDALAAAAARADQAEAARDRLLAEHGFDGVDAVDAAVRDPANIDRLRTGIDSHHRTLVAAETVLADPEVDAALDGEAPDLVALEERAAVSRRAADAAIRERASAEGARQRFAGVRARVEDECAQVGPAHERARLVRGLADLVTGTSADNDRRMRLSTYVLAARLERIVELANDRLTAMADGRYELAHDDRSARGQRRGGLGLKVQDLWTGQERPTTSLSGGESFVCSLSLALGLADAIREESGGREFGTLFVDEGFGALDEDSLEQVLDVLDGLRDGGRTVGLVSHVAEMRTRIPTQVHVGKTPTGSFVEVA